MNKLIALLASACLAGCAAAGSPGSSPSVRTKPTGRPIQCMQYPENYGLCMHTCAHEDATARAATAHCQASPANARPPGCETAGMETGQYGMCIARCAAMPPECR